MFIRLLKLFRLVHKMIRAGFSKMPPAYLARGVEQELGDSGDVAAVLASFRNQQVIAADDNRPAIGKQGKGDLVHADQFLRFVVGVGADGNRLDACRCQRSQVALYPP